MPSYHVIADHYGLCGAERNGIFDFFDSVGGVAVSGYALYQFVDRKNFAFKL